LGARLYHLPRLIRSGDVNLNMSCAMLG
jgi:hypothetical protein